MRQRSCAGRHASPDENPRFNLIYGAAHTPLTTQVNTEPGPGGPVQAGTGWFSLRIAQYDRPAAAPGTLGHHRSHLHEPPRHVPRPTGLRRVPRLTLPPRAGRPRQGAPAPLPPEGSPRPRGHRPSSCRAGSTSTCAPRIWSRSIRHSGAEGPRAWELRTEVYTDPEADLILVWAASQTKLMLVHRLRRLVHPALHGAPPQRDSDAASRPGGPRSPAYLPRRQGPQALMVSIAPPLVPILEDDTHAPCAPQCPSPPSSSSTRAPQKGG